MGRNSSTSAREPHASDFCFWLQADMQPPEFNFRFAPNSRHSIRDVRFGPVSVCFTPSSGPSWRSPKTSAPGRVGMWRGGGRIGLSVSAPLVWRCLNSRAMTPFPHPAHRTGRALLTHPALGQDTTPSHTEGHEQPSGQPLGPWNPSVLRSPRLLANRQCHHLGRQ